MRKDRPLLDAILKLATIPASADGLIGKILNNKGEPQDAIRDPKKGEPQLAMGADAKNEAPTNKGPAAPDYKVTQNDPTKTSATRAYLVHILEKTAMSPMMSRGTPTASQYGASIPGSTMSVPKPPPAITQAQPITPAATAMRAPRGMMGGGTPSTPAPSSAPRYASERPQLTALLEKLAQFTAPPVSAPGLSPTGARLGQNVGTTPAMKSSLSPQAPPRLKPLPQG